MSPRVALKRPESICYVFLKRFRHTAKGLTLHTQLHRLDSAFDGTLTPTRGGHFPFPREKGSEKGSGQSVAGVARKPDFSERSG